jgi:hypothetical protein
MIYDLIQETCLDRSLKIQQTNTPLTQNKLPSIATIMNSKRGGGEVLFYVTRTKKHTHPKNTSKSNN